MTTLDLTNIIPALTEAWITGDFDPPSILLAYEELYDTWYFVVDDRTSILELGDVTGAVYVIPKSKCRVVGGKYYLCRDVIRIQDYPVTNQQYFVTESLFTLPLDAYNFI